MGETRVDLHHLLQDLADAYPGDLHETVLTEVVANALDSGASRISIAIDPTESTLTIVDNGIGMRRADLRRFHDVATSAKVRGAGIGFAGVGIKLGLLVSAEVITESRRGTSHIATSWSLASRKRAPWRWIPPIGMVAERGTAVRFRLENPLGPLLDAGFIEVALRTHFEPLFDPAFDEVLAGQYPDGVRFELNSRLLERQPGIAETWAPIALRIGRRRKPSAVGYAMRTAEALEESRRGIAISTLGKVIKRGWDWIGISPAAVDRISGLIEAPELAAALTLNKADFLRTGPRGATYLSYRKGLQEAIGATLALWGDDRETQAPERRRVARPIERDVEHVLAQLADDFPMLAMLVDMKAGGNHRQRVGSPGTAVTPDAPDLFSPGESAATHSEQVPVTETPSAADDATAQTSRRSETAPPAVVEPRRRSTRQRATRLRLGIQFESRPDDPELARLVETTVWVNDAHAAYRRAAGSRSEAYHIALAVALALAKVAVESTAERSFLLEFLDRWGAAAERRR